MSNRRLSQHDTKASALQYVATHTASQIMLHDGGERCKPFILGLPMGRIPLEVYSALVSLHKSGQVTFRNVVTFNLDESVLWSSSDDSRSFHTYMHEHFFRRIDIAPENVHFPGEEGCRRVGEYEWLIDDLGGINLMLCGVGDNDHVAFNEPLGASENLTTSAVPTLLANRLAGSSDGNNVDPAKSVTVGLKAMLESKELVIVALGKEKAAVVKNAIEGPGGLKSPLGMLLLKHPNAVLVVDKEAAGELSSNTLEVGPVLTSFLPPSHSDMCRCTLTQTQKALSPRRGD